MRTLLGTMVVTAFAVAGSAVSAHANTTVTCPLQTATRTIVNQLPAGWSAAQTASPVTNWRVDVVQGKQVLICEYGQAGSIQRQAPVGENCTKIPNRRFQCVGLPPPPPPQAGVISEGQLVIADNNTLDLDDGGSPDMRLRADNPFLRTLEPMNGAQFSPQGTAKPTYQTCVAAPYSPVPIPQAQLPIGVWLCVATSDGNVGRIRIAGINGIVGLPIPMTIFLEHTTWGQGGNNPPQPPQPPQQPQTVATGILPIPQTFRFDLDNGSVGAGPGADFWFQAVNPIQLYIRPVNGAQIAVGNKQNRGFNGCSAEAFSPNPVLLSSLQVGNYICAATNEGRVSQFRVNGISPGSPKTLTIGFTTWEQ
jgi:hypothetical protein